MTLIDRERIIKAKEVICETILLQVKSGAQSEKFENALACGQFLKVPEKQQHGFHGTTAAIRILAGFAETYNDELRKLITYFEEIVNLKGEVITNDGLSMDKINIIKNAELLYTLSYIHSGTKNTEELKKSIYDNLIKAKNRDGGWAFFMGENDDSDVYSTSLVYLAFKKHNYNNLSNTLTFIKDNLKKYLKENIPDPTTFSKLCFTVYSLVKLDFHKTDKDIKKLLAEVNKKLWKSEYCVLNNDYEQNIEYPSKERHFYVRIPWQLYLISVANELSPRYFAKKLSISRLNSPIVSILDNEGGYATKSWTIS